MSVYRRWTQAGEMRWHYRKVVRLADGSKQRISGTPSINTKAAALDAERAHVERTLRPAAPARAAVPALSDWFHGAFWTGWVLAEQNKPGEQENKRSLFRLHLEPDLGSLPIDAIDVARVQELKAALATKIGRTGRPLSKKTINGVLAVLSKALGYAEECGVIEEAPRVRLHKVPLPEVQAWEFDDYGRLLHAAAADTAPWSTAVLLAGDSGLRLGELLALEWPDVDLEGGVLTVRRQLRRGEVGTPKGGRTRVVPMTTRLQRHLRGLAQIRRGRVLRGPDGGCELEGAAKHIIYDLCEAAELPRRSWHCLRHSYATHLAHFGVNPWSLQSWLGHTAIEMTLRYVRYAERYRRIIPADILAAGEGHANPDERALAMLGARGPQLIGCGTGVARRRSENAKGPESGPSVVAGAGFEPATFGL